MDTLHLWTRIVGRVRLALTLWDHPIPEQQRTRPPGDLPRRLVALQLSRKTNPQEQ